MGSKSLSDMYQQNKISKEEAECLSGFCNLFGPGYFVGILLPVLESTTKHALSIAIFIVYILPILYGIVLTRLYPPLSDTTITKKEQASNDYFLAFQNSCKDSVNSILMLGGYVAFCCALTGILHEIMPSVSYGILLPFIEINQGILFLQEMQFNAYWKIYIILLSISFQGLCCFLQAAAFLSNAKLSVAKYLKYKIYYTIFAFFVITILMIFKIK